MTTMPANVTYAQAAATVDGFTTARYARCRPVLAPRGCYLPTTGLVNSALAVRTAATGGPRVVDD